MFHFFLSHNVRLIINNSAMFTINFKNVSRRVRNYQAKKQSLLKSKKSNKNRFLLSIIKEIVKDFFKEYIKHLMFSSIKDKVKDLFDFFNDSPIIDYVFSLFHIKSILMWLIDLLNP